MKAITIAMAEAASPIKAKRGQQHKQDDGSIIKVRYHLTPEPSEVEMYVTSKTSPTTRVQGARFTEGQRILLKAIIHHAPLTPRSTQSTGLFKRASEYTGTFSRKIKPDQLKLFGIRECREVGDPENRA